MRSKRNSNRRQRKLKYGGQSAVGIGAIVLFIFALLAGAAFIRKKRKNKADTIPTTEEKEEIFAVLRADVDLERKIIETFGNKMNEAEDLVNKKEKKMLNLIKAWSDKNEGLRPLDAGLQDETIHSPGSDGYVNIIEGLKGKQNKEARLKYIKDLYYYTYVREIIDGSERLRKYFFPSAEALKEHADNCKIGKYEMAKHDELIQMYDGQIKQVTAEGADHERQEVEDAVDELQKKRDAISDAIECRAERNIKLAERKAEREALEAEGID